MLRPPPTSTLFPYTTLFRSQSDDVERRALSHVVDVALVCHSEHKYAAPVYRLSLFVQCLGNFPHDYRRHLTVDLAGEIDEPRLVVERSHLPGEIVRV